MNNRKVTVETEQEARFTFEDVDAILVSDGNLYLVTRRISQQSTIKWWEFWKTPTANPINDADVVAVHAKGTWRHAFRNQSETSAARATVEKVQRDSAC